MANSLRTYLCSEEGVQERAKTSRLAKTSILLKQEKRYLHAQQPHISKILHLAAITCQNLGILLSFRYDKGKWQTMISPILVSKAKKTIALASFMRNSCYFQHWCFLYIVRCCFVNYCLVVLFVTLFPHRNVTLLFLKVELGGRFPFALNPEMMLTSLACGASSLSP